jgi:hypothetical protein
MRMREASITWAYKTGVVWLGKMGTLHERRRDELESSSSGVWSVKAQRTSLVFFLNALSRLIVLTTYMDIASAKV